MSEISFFTVPDLVARWKGTVAARTIYSWTQKPHRGPRRAEQLRPLVAFTVADVEAFERTNARLVLAASKLGCNG